jgi:WhiB family redox-sensing transcriptional regulator
MDSTCRLRNRIGGFLPTRAMTEILASAAHFPFFEGAACLGRWDLFDQRPGTDPNREHIETQALALCNTCPALQACRHWFDSLPPRQRPAGVIAGKIHRRQFACAGP